MAKLFIVIFLMLAAPFAMADVPTYKYLSDGDLIKIDSSDPEVIAAKFTRRSR